MASLIEGNFLRPLGHVGPLIGLYTPVIRCECCFRSQVIIETVVSGG